MSFDDAHTSWIFNRQFNSTRRQAIKCVALGAFAGGAVLFSTPGLFAEELTRTPSQTEGPFYPDHLPLDTDNDLLMINEGITPAVGEITHSTGRVLSNSGEPVRNAVVEIWQADSNGVYIHSRGGDRRKQDGNFQGFGRFTTGSEGEYYFRTIKPVKYAGRTPHIHFAVKKGGRRVLTTQCYIDGEPQNNRDGIFRRTGTEEQKRSLLVKFEPINDSTIGELTANFDIVLGRTAQDG